MLMPGCCRPGNPVVWVQTVAVPVNRLAIPLLILNRIGRGLIGAVDEAGLPRLRDIAIDAPLGLMQQRIPHHLHHLHQILAHLLGPEELAGRPAEGDPGELGLGLQQRQEDELALAFIQRRDRTLDEDGANRILGRRRIALDIAQLAADGIGDLAVELARHLDDVVARGTGPGEMDQERRAEHAQHDEEGQRRAQRHAPARNGSRRRSPRAVGATGRRLSYRSR